MPLVDLLRRHVDIVIYGYFEGSILRFYRRLGHGRHVAAEVRWGFLECRWIPRRFVFQADTTFDR